VSGVHGLDVSNYQPRDLSGLIQQYNIQHVVVRLWLPGEKPDPGYALDQIWSALANGCTVSGYFWAYRAWEPEWSVDEALELWARAGVGQIPNLACDVESYGYEGCPDEAWARRARAQTHANEALACTYIADWVVDSYWGSYVSPDFADTESWLANYNGQVVPTCPSNYWTTQVGHQFSGNPVDLNSFDPWMTAPSGEVAPPSPPQPSYEDLQSSIGYMTHDLANGYDAEAQHLPFPRASQIQAITELLRGQALAS
jgi:hypothetical protein